MNGLVTGAAVATAALAATMLAALPVYGLAPLPAGINLLLAVELGAAAACALTAAVRHAARTSKED